MPLPTARGLLVALMAGAAMVAFPAMAAPAASPAMTATAGLPLVPARVLHHRVDAGTWMSLSVSPDGRTILFDMLGDIYAMPAGGGTARLVLAGMAFETQPAFSPDGRWIAFVSDRSGSDNLWVAHPDGTAPRQITFSDDETVWTSPAWRADGGAVFASHYRPDLNNYELVEQPLSGAMQVIAPIRQTTGQPRDDWHSALGASASADGRFLYFARREGGLDFDEVTHWSIIRRDLASGHEDTVIAGPEGRGTARETFFRPVIAPDGRHLAYATHRAGTTFLRVRDLATGLDTPLGETEPDTLRASSWQDLIPAYAFTPDSRAILITHAGGFERRGLDGSVTHLPFTADLALAVGPSTRVALRERTGPISVRLPMAAMSSPDGTRVAFSALGRIYVEGADGVAHALPPAPDPAFQPAWSADGRTLAFVTWNEAAGGHVWVQPADGSAPPRKVDDLPAFYTYPVFDPAGGQLLVVRSAAAERQQLAFEITKLRPAELVAQPLAGGAARVIASGTIGSRPQFTTTAPGQVFLFARDGLERIDLASGARHVAAVVKGAGYYFQESPVPVDDLRISADGRWLVAEVAQQLHLIPTPAAGATVDLLAPASGQRQITDIGADYFETMPDGGIEWSVGPQHWRMATTDAKPQRLADLAVSVPRATPVGSLLLRGARVLTMAHGDAILPDADILITGDRIAAIGPRGTLAIPAGTAVRDVTGKIILPGFIDEHDHIGEVRREVLSWPDWGLAARLAWGVTTSFDPSTLSIDMIAYQDAIDAGLVLGPRLRSTGVAVFSFNRFQSLDEVRSVLRRYSEAYELGNIKEYRTGNRRVREWVAMACRELGLQPTTEGALSLKLDLSQAIDGFAGNEHALAAPLHQDVIDLFTDMRTSYATTLMITNTGPQAADWFVTQRAPADDPKMQRFWPAFALRQKLLERPWVAQEEERYPDVARGAAALAAAGGLVGMGAHGEVPGPGLHWEMEAHVAGGMAPMAVLHAATAGSAETIGRLGDLGTLEPGKLADLVVLDADPLSDIRNTQHIASVMRGGFLYDAATLAEVWPEVRPGPVPQNAAPRVEQWLPVVQ